MKTNARTFSIALASTLLSTTAMAAGLSFDMGHTVQNCQHPGHPPTWCDGAPPSTDIKDSTTASGLEAKIVAQLDRALQNPAHAKVLAAEFSFSNKRIQSKICE